jgi:hypothetical protein
MLVAAGAAAGIAGAAAVVATGADTAGASTGGQGARLVSARPATASPAAADQATVSYLTSHYPGSGTARVLATERDHDRGQAVYDVRALAPDGTVYVVHVSQASGAVLWTSRAESQTAGTTPTPGHSAGRDDNGTPRSAAGDSHLGHLDSPQQDG